MIVMPLPTSYAAEAVRLQPFMVELDGDRPGGDHTVTAVTDIDFDTWALTLDRPLGTLSTGGENGVKVNLSVVGVGVGDLPYTLRLNVLQGDVNQSGAVLADDFSDVKKKFFRSTAAPGAAGDTQYTVFHDVNGSGSILADDFSEVKKRFFDTLQGGAAAPAAHPTAAAIAAPTRPRTLPVTRSLFGDQPLLPAQALAAESHQVMVVGSASADRFFSFRPVESPVFRPRG